jgi:hypothetical protein
MTVFERRILLPLLPFEDYRDISTKHLAGITARQADQQSVRMDNINSA